MIPALFCWLERLPLSGNGKVDRPSLPDPHLVAPVQPEGSTTATAIESVVLRLWRGALEMPTLGLDHNFFAAGGSSLQAVVLGSEIATVFRVELSLDTIFSSPSVREISAVIAHQRDDTAGSR